MMGSFQLVNTPTAIDWRQAKKCPNEWGDGFEVRVEVDDF
jgi:hypothetical protein